VAALHLLAVATAEVRAADKLCTGDLQALRSIYSALASSSIRTSFIYPSSKVTLR
jgi:hypothetical protein